MGRLERWVPRVAPPFPGYGWALRNLILPIGDAAMRQGMMRRLRFLESAQWWNRERLLRYQAERLQELLHVAHREVPYYRDLADRAGISPASINGPKDLWRWPISTKESLRAAYPEGVRRDSGLPPYEVSTSGSTGKNFVTLYDAEVEGSTRALTMLKLQWSGWRPGEPHLQTGITTDRDGARRIKDFALRCYYELAYDLTTPHLDAMLETLDRHRIRFVFGFAASLHELARRAIATGWNRPLGAVVSWGDAMFDHYRQAIGDAFQCPIFDTYGCSEGIIVAAQCPEGRYHVFDPEVVVEVVDDDGAPVAAGERGAYILTRLHPGPMPLIRYRVGDTGAIATAGPCSCGRGFGLITGVSGRSCDVIVTRSGNRLIVHFFTGILEHFREIDAFQAVQREEGALELLVTLQPGAEPTPNLKHRILEALRRHGADLRIDVRVVDEIPLTPAGKRRFIISEVPSS